MRLRRLGIAVAVCLMGSLAGAAPQTSTVLPATDLMSDLVLRLHDLGGAQVQYASCCKTCRKGKACGDSCISREKSCRVGRGCACNG